MKTLAATVARLPVRDGGIDLSDYASRRHAMYAATYWSVWPECRRACPDLCAISLADPAPHHLGAVSFASSWDSVRATLATVRARHARLDRTVRHCVDGSTHSAYHPHLKK